MNAIAPGGWGINPKLETENRTDDEGNPTGGSITLDVPVRTPDNHAVNHALVIHWQNGPREKLEDGNLSEPNGAFVEDAIYAAYQRLAFFQDSKFKCAENEQAMKGLRDALEALNDRRVLRDERGVTGSHEV